MPFVAYVWKVPTTGPRAFSAATQLTTGAFGSWTWTTSKPPSRRAWPSTDTPYGVNERFETAPFAGMPTVRPSGTSHEGTARGSGRAPRWAIRARRSSGSYGASSRTSCPRRSNSPPRDSTCLPTPPGYVNEYGETSAMRTETILAHRLRSDSFGFCPISERFSRFVRRFRRSARIAHRQQQHEEPGLQDQGARVVRQGARHRRHQGAPNRRPEGG